MQRLSRDFLRDLRVLVVLGGSTVQLSLSQYSTIGYVGRYLVALEKGADSVMILALISSLPIRMVELGLH